MWCQKIVCAIIIFSVIFMVDGLKKLTKCFPSTIKRFISSDMANSSAISQGLSSAMERTGQWVFSHDVQLPTDLVINVGDATFPLHKFILMAKSGYIRAKILGSNNSDPTRVDLSQIPGGAQTFEKAIKFCYGVNFQITVYNVAALRCAAGYLEMTEWVCDGNLTKRTEEFLGQVALKTLLGAVTVLKSCEGLGLVAEEIGLVQRCVEVISLKACNEQNFPTCTPTDWWLPELTSLTNSSLQQILLSMKTHGASSKTLFAIITAFAEKSFPEFIHPKNSALPLPDPSPAIRTHQASLLNSITHLLKSTSIPVPISFLCLLLRAAIFLNSSNNSKRELEVQIAACLDQVSVGDLLVIALDCSGQRVVDIDSVRRIIGLFVEKQGGGLYGGGVVGCSATVQQVTKTFDAFVGEIAADEDLGVSKFAGVAGALPESARRFDDDLYRAVDIYLKAHPGLDEIEREKVCSVLNPLRLSYEARLHASQNKRLPLQVVLHALYYDQLKLRSTATFNDNIDPTPPPLSTATTARSRAVADASLMKENEELRSELTRMKLYLSDLEMTKKVGSGIKKSNTFLASVSRTLGRAESVQAKGYPRDTLNIDEGSMGSVARVGVGPGGEAFSIS
ncbi:uncharacterized protein A4U43_C02F15260 [Asparagus officinalis]|uniref:NPH3 domain-containing protein n=1 Tax=Asparagus officinalis TaxID=4686 RepID=A0A5P1FJ74_ASPOF|nr:root phototropism protein 2 [Asparagus officinalis]ONK78172.1 uncharacterized protein A4U43_C02F15260 [Asparagus officinalis]